MAAIGPLPVGLWFTTPAFKRANADALKRFAGVIYQTARWANAHPRESAPIVAKYTKLALDDVTAMRRADFAEALRPAELQPPLDAALKFGFLPRAIRAEELLEA